MLLIITYLKSYRAGVHYVDRAFLLTEAALLQTRQYFALNIGVASLLHLSWNNYVCKMMVESSWGCCSVFFIFSICNSSVWKKENKWQDSEDIVYLYKSWSNMYWIFVSCTEDKNELQEYEFLVIVVKPHWIHETAGRITGQFMSETIIITCPLWLRVSCCLLWRSWSISGSCSEVVED